MVSELLAHQAQRAQEKFKSPRRLPRKKTHLEPYLVFSCQPIRRGVPEFAETQRDDILQMLRERRTDGVSRAELIFEKRYSQCGARVDELKRMGYVIRSELREGETYVRYILVSEPLELKPLTTIPPKHSTGDWYTDATGQRRPRGQSFGPLFDNVESGQ